MIAKPPALVLTLILALGWLAGCNTVSDVNSARTAAPFEPTALIIADETGPLTADELATHRPKIIQYLVSRGYLKTPDALVDNPALASRFIRVILSPGGGFRITEFTLGNRARQIITTSFYPGHSDDYYDHGRYGYYLGAQPYYEIPAPRRAAPPDSYRPPTGKPPVVQRPTGDHPRRHGRRVNPEGRSETPRSDYADRGGGNGGSGSAPTPPSYAPPEPRSADGDSRHEERHRPNEP